ncbi:probable RNA-binding protein CG14230 [Drosophila takahashii]|uniref:probable RNA-binding protein CG14230 n=1 Tax=Drosophila takahashii TaxID=29030 RepID=UPI001CF92458|nr:probable RNA-binding protein CG14230 [Drosophila takahashii]
MAGTRFFLADLPTRTSEADLRSLFQDYGHVEHVDLKRKEQDGATKVIAFVTLQTDDAQYCVNELNWQRLHGDKLRVSLAKESFLDRLKREREEQQRREQGEPEESEFQAQPSSQLLAQSGQNKRRVFGEDEEIGDDEIAPELLITKKRAAHSMHNGRIVIQQEHDVKPLHIIEQHRKPAKLQADAQVSQAEQKRKESLNKMRQGHQQKKTAIQQALSAISVDGGQAKRIKFSDPEEEEDAKPAKKQKRDLFEGDDEDEDEEAAEHIVLPQHKGKKGERLVEMQSKQSIDPRFRITSNFVDEEEDEEEEEAGDQPEPEESERKWQMNILEQVVGHKISDNDGKQAKSKKMLRFDPAKEDSQKLVRQKQPKEEEEDLAKSKAKPKAKGAEGSEPAPVSKTAFYMVTDTLKDSLNSRGEGFSLLDMFGSAPDEEVAKRQDQLEKLGQEKILVGKASASKLGLATLNPFSYDSSDSEGEDEAKAPKEEQDLEVSKENQAQPAKKSSQKKSKIKMESFFIPKNDPRLKEGAKFFKSAKPEVDQADYDQVRNRLKLLISNKIAKTKKNLPSKDIKQYRNKKAKN